VVAGLALLVITPEEKVVTVLGAIARVPGGARLIEGLAKTSWGRKIGRKMMQWSYTAKGAARIGTKQLHNGVTGTANTGYVRVGISNREAALGGPVFSVRIGPNKHIDFNP
jgi:hypothetical protein